MKTLGTVLLTAIYSLPLFGGGFYLTVHPPAEGANVPSGAVLVARLSGCHQPEKGTVSARAEGIVNGKSQIIDLKLVALKTPGTFALEKQWPGEGKWVVTLVAKHPSIAAVTSTAVPVQGGKVEFASAKWEMGRVIAASEVMNMLQ
jgi:hypothetical protein